MSPKTDLESERMKRIPYASTVGPITYSMICTRTDVTYALGAWHASLAHIPGCEGDEGRIMLKPEDFKHTQAWYTIHRSTHATENAGTVQQNKKIYSIISSFTDNTYYWKSKVKVHNV